MAEVVRARDRDDWCLEQWRQALRWLEDHGFDPDAATFEGEALARKIARAFPQNSAALKRKGGRPTAVDWDVVKKEAIRLLNYHGEFGSDSPNWNAQARLEEALEDYCETKFGTRPARSTLQGHVPPWLVEWRNSKTRCPGNLVSGRFRAFPGRNSAVRRHHPVVRSRTRTRTGDQNA